ncbi:MULTISPECIES: DUF397 domain-containing protein [unclassified Saccharopolyspora]|uniref:DUF397 domain-containing protein n=1 Tax=unclassified Saccharopolyspora TaxID=2646250 RepID=UPI001CD32147|nr:MULTISPECIES: DUF397 domain-containing protein [unclassified Saccharopolyspora]MCA1188882.1 DUF397 domain-containing protein [Saccharopolyspora sp. 6T]MCA1195455.1 DUF397 domain-containing protein [Saccharopolyspora sp. 6V]MCA1227293.1 DUF397 domain-containing protein [Saccharopolyspora sp. 6M]MCA1279821.1 DUF397 domain-containing protein [Saccharopolyspora sp. 7B]
MKLSRFDEVVWRKSSRSASKANCVEVALGGQIVGVRDSKDPGGPVLAVSGERWADFLAAVGDSRPR